MLFGNPHEFAIWADVVTDWGFGRSTCGVYILCVNGTFLIKRSSLSANSTVISGESKFWANCIAQIDTSKHTEVSNRSPELLFLLSRVSRYGFESIDPAITCGRSELLQYLEKNICEDNPPGIELTPIETGDSAWHIYLFFDESSNQDLVVYANLADPIFVVNELRMPAGRMREILANFVAETKIFDQPQPISD